jgi:hypothetical protein
VTDRIEQQPQPRCVEREIDGAFGSVHHSPASVPSIVRLRRTHCWRAGLSVGRCVSQGEQVFPMILRRLNGFEGIT